MPRDSKLYLQDICDAADAILGFVNGKTIEDYLASLVLRSAVERQFSIIGEAVV